ncbi:hypothetical protein AWV80_09080 [Cupriavidus sp. UYMU48A]|nr:hypothetical protein AWV80_09080 [Cupriavidus sp. UYMU48A]
MEIEHGQPPKPPVSDVAPACSGCGAVDANTYAGAGVGVWQNQNATTTVTNVPISIAGLTGQDVTLVLTNDSATAQPMPTVSLTASYYQNFAANQLQWAATADDTKTRIAEFNRSGWASLAGAKVGSPSFSATGAPSGSAVNDTKVWYHEDNTTRNTTLVKQMTTSDGVSVNFWVETAEYTTNKVTPAIVDTLAQGFASTGKIYDMLKSVAARSGAIITAI